MPETGSKSNCAKGCGNCYFRRFQFVGTRGNPRAPIVFVGESPGATELRTGKPFMGPSGKVLNDAIRSVGGKLTEDDYLVINALECLPRRVNDTAKNTKHLQGAVLRCRDRLLEQIGQYPRAVIVALGNGALWGLTGNTSHKITQVRGSLFPSELSERGIVAAVHPAYLLRGGGSYQKFKRDIDYALELARGGPVRKAVVPTWNVAETEADAIDFIDHTFDLASRTGEYVVAADTETGGFDFRRDEILALGWATTPDEVFIVPDALLRAGVLRHRDFHRGSGVGAYHPNDWKPGPFRWCWHNGKFDVKFMHAYDYDATVDDDTMLMSYTLEERRGYHDLEQVANDEVGAPNYKAMLDSYLPNKKSSYRIIPKPVLYEYLAYDVSNTLQIRSSLLPKVNEDRLNARLYHETLLPASELLAEVEKNGMLVDFAAVEENAEHYLKIMAEQHEILNYWALKADPRLSYKTSGTKAKGGGQILKGVNPNSPIQLAHVIYTVLKLGKVNKGTDDDALDKLPKHKFVTALKAYRKAAKAYGTYVKSLHEQVSDDGRVHSTYLIHGTPTGRLASRGPNMQNQPRGPRIRGQFIAAPGYEIGEFDLSQAELRCLAALSKDPVLCKIYQTAGMSIHKEVALFMSETGRIKPDWKKRYGLNDPNDPVYIEAYDEYMRVKALNFGIVYGRTAPSIAEEFGITVAQGQEMIRGWAERFPVAWEFIERCRLAPTRGQNLTTPFGRRKRVGVVSREALTDLQNEAANFPHQSIASDITLRSAHRVWRTLKANGVLVVNLIHDAILCEIPLQEGYFDRTARLVTSTLTQMPRDMGITIVPFVSDAKRGKSWGQLKEYDFVRDPQEGDWYLPEMPVMGGREVIAAQ